MEGERKYRWNPFIMKYVLPDDDAGHTYVICFGSSPLLAPPSLTSLSSLKRGTSDIYPGSAGCICLQGAVRLTHCVEVEARGP